MLILTFDYRQLTALRGALELARENAATLRGIEGHGIGNLIAQFNRQAADCETLLEKLEA